MSDIHLNVRVLGCGSSGGVPRVGGEWGVCDPSNPKNRRTRCCILVHAQENTSGAPTDKTSILIDTSPDLRTQLLDAEIKRLDAVLMTHHHADQCHGIDDIRPLAIRQRKAIPVHMDQETAAVLTTRFDYCFAGTPAYPAILEPHIDLAAGETLQIKGAGPTLPVLTLDQDHGSCRSLGFRIGNFAYCNDLVRLPDESRENLRGLDTLIVDALRYTPHPTHANVEQALAWIEELKPKNAILTNMHVDLDYDVLNAETPDNVFPAYDGMELQIPAP